MLESGKSWQLIHFEGFTRARLAFPAKSARMGLTFRLRQNARFEIHRAVQWKPIADKEPDADNQSDALRADWVDSTHPESQAGEIRFRGARQESAYKSLNC